MYISCLFVWIFPRRFWPWKGWVVVSLVFFLISFCLFFAISPALGAQKHGCAPDIPPPVSGIPSPILSGKVLINEVLNQPVSTWNCSEPANRHSLAEDSWIELYNQQSQSFDLYGARAQISLDRGTTWDVFPLGSVIASGGFLVFFPEAHAQITSPLWNVELAINTAIIDQVSVPLLQPDQSYARIPDGSNSWQFVGQPTIDASNTTSSQLGSTETCCVSRSGEGGISRSNVPTGHGTQPAWSQIQIPSGTDTPNAVLPTPSVTPALNLIKSPSAATPLSNSLDSGHILLIAALIVLFSGAAIWSWRLFHTP